MADGQPYQVILDVVSPKLDLVNLTKRLERDAEIERRALDEARSPFDLATGPLLRLKLFRLDRDEHMLVVTLHHVVADGWSIAVFIRDSSALYSASIAGTTPSLPKFRCGTPTTRSGSDGC